MGSGHQAQSTLNLITTKAVSNYADTHHSTCMLPLCNPSRKAEVARTGRVCHYCVMRIGSFELQEPLPNLRSPHVIASLNPWMDAGSVGTLTLTRLERFLNASELGSLITPGKYFDFTQYRPTMTATEEGRHTTVPNAFLRYAHGANEFDFIFLHMLEPHALAEEYIDSVVDVLKYLGVRRYLQVGAWYGDVPHTRPLPVNVSLNREPVPGLGRPRRRRRQGTYQGPTSILNIVADWASDHGIENMSIMAQLPYYLKLEADYTGRGEVLKALTSLYDFPRELAESARGKRQYAEASTAVENSPEAKELVEQLETEYDASVDPATGEETSPSEETPKLPRSVEKLLQDLEDQS